MNEQKLKQLEREEKGKQQKLPEAGAEFDSSQLNTDVFNTVIAFRMLEIMRNNGLIDESEYAKVEKKRARYKGNVIELSVVFYGRSLRLSALPYRFQSY